MYRGHILLDRTYIYMLQNQKTKNRVKEIRRKAGLKIEIVDGF